MEYIGENFASDPAAGIISQGTVVRVGFTSGRIILDTTTENDELCSHLVTRIAQECASRADVPRLCLTLRWKPPVPLHMADEPAGPAGEMKPLFLEATAVVSALQEVHYANKLSALFDDYCLVCLDPAEDIDLRQGDRDENCVRCLPCSLCEKCRATVEGKQVCLQCIECDEERLLDPSALRRKRLVECNESPVEDGVAS
jgi:hypothetical protein